MHIFEREVDGRRYRIAAQSVWDAAEGRSVGRQVLLGLADPPSAVDLGQTRTVGTKAVGDVGALVWVAEPGRSPRFPYEFSGTAQLRGYGTARCS